MPRLYLVFLFFWTWPCTSYSQVKIRDVIEFADKQFKKGDYYYATQMYDKALQMDSTSIELFWKQAESYRAYKNYELAAQWYAKVYAVDAEKSYPSALMYYALMTKQMGNYTAALALFKKAYKEVSDAPDDYLYKKTKQEIKSTEYAIKTQQKKGISINPFSTEINSYDAEFGHLYKNGVFYFSSLKADSINTKEEVYSTFYRTNTYRANNQGQTFTPPTVWKDLIVNDKSTGNGSFDSQGWYYYSLCEDKGFSYRCKIVRYKEGVGVDTLNEIINQPGSNTTHPSWAKLKNGKTYLFFSSDREGGNGGMDLWYAAIQSDGSFDEPKNISSLNSMENEITPWFDSDSSRLFFSSNWHLGYGGYDVFEVKIGDKLQFSKPLNVGLPINSPANDLYYFRQSDSVFVSSNRLGSLSKKNPTCCSDIFYGLLEKPNQSKIDSLPPPPLITFPVSLFFRNDYPNPKSYARKSNVSYDVLYSDYNKAKPSYIDSTSNKEALTSFFTNNVDFGYQVLLKLYDSVVHEVARGNSILLFARGYASPLNVTQYNVNLTQRRISSVYKFFMEYQGGALEKLLQSNKDVSFEIIEVPLGEYAANQSTSDNGNDRASSVYSVAASIERKVEILYMTRTQTENLQRISASPLVQEDEIKEGSSVTKWVNIEHDLTEIEINEIKFSQEGLSYQLKAEGDHHSSLSFTFKPEFTGKHASCFADIYFDGITEPIRIYFTFLKK